MVGCLLKNLKIMNQIVLKIDEVKCYESHNHR